MAVTLEALEKRMRELEIEVAELRHLVIANPNDLPGHQGKRSRADLPATVADVFRNMGIPPEPPALTSQELRELMIADGIDPNDNAASREIIRMRDE